MLEKRGEPEEEEERNCPVIVFLMPLVYRPEEDSFAGRFLQLSKECCGYIFAAGSPRNVTLGRFEFLGVAYRQGIFGRFASRMWIQVLYPALMLRRKSRLDCVVTYDPYASGLAGVVLKWILGCSLIVEVNGDYHESEPSQDGLKRRVMRWVMHLSLRSADAVKVLNRSQEQYVSARYPLTQVVKLHNPIANQYFEGLQTFQGDYLLSIGYPFHLKGMDVLIKAFWKIADRYPRVKLRIMGYCPTNENKPYLELARYSPRIEFVKPAWIKEVGEQMRGCYALVHAARTEAMGRVQLEAMACKKPIVTTMTNGGKECVEHDVTGYHCAIDDIEDLAGKIDQLLSDPPRAAAMGQAGYDRLRAHFSMEKYCVSFLRMVGTLRHV